MDYLEELKALALDSLENSIKDNSGFIPRIHIIGKKEEKIVFLPFKDEEEKREMFLTMGAMAFEENSHQMIFICDTYIRKMSSAQEAKEVGENWDTERPSTYPEHLRSEALVLHSIDFKNSENDKLLLITYKKKDQKITDINEEPMPFNSIEGSIKDYLSEGFCQAKVIDFLQRKELTLEQLNSKSMPEIEEIFLEVSREIKRDFPNIKP
jgi:hypothetical protein